MRGPLNDRNNPHSVKADPITAFGRSFVVYIALTQPPREDGVKFSGGGFDMVKFFRVLSLLALSYFCAPSAAQAIPITISFSGTLTQATAAGCVYCGAYNATIGFDTSDGLFQQTGPNTYYFAPPYGDFGHIFAQFSNGISIYADGGGDYVAWSPGLLTGNIGGYFSHLALPSDGVRYIQVGTCGSFCSFISVDHFSVSGLPVPGPIVGAGLPGLLIAVAGFIGWRCSRRAPA
ncbi:hypothetical protein IVB30_19725 [Bradyrhizobium sp. 200]|uniref:hypothetical protein n=1 Tax=Bradyrhizobium sp. 200 TaxID=2782665 RepID=UPI001FFFCE4B|nr:hypothetical protein [Bradyrhizobium sp. 200]UPJ53343.1 hypothetical protein IVB30_19725 [Bradyrhizobium sp. 200]